jgi:hypothetical protein
MSERLKKIAFDLGVNFLKDLSGVCAKYYSKMNKCSGCPLRKSYSISREPDSGRCFKEIPPKEWDVDFIQGVVFKFVAKNRNVEG